MVLFTAAVWWALYQHRLTRIFDAAAAEQHRREKVAKANGWASYTHDQRVQAMQDRLTRALGRRCARGAKMKARILLEFPP